MSIQSMTGFARHELANETHSLTLEMKSVNNRFKDVRFKMPNIFNAYEIELKKLLESQFKRGSFDIYVNLKKVQGKSSFDDLDFEKIKSFKDKMKDVLGKHVVFSATDFLRSDFTKDQSEEREEALKELLFECFSSALKELGNSRSGEGLKLKQIIEDHLSEYRKHFAIVESNLESFEKLVRERILKKFSEYKEEIKIEDSRFAQEIIFYLEKMDVHEEVNRIKTHLTKLDKIIGQGGEVGRQIDFLLQELGRETNTIGSKSTLEEISASVIQMKVQLEKIREQGLNLE